MKLKCIEFRNYFGKKIKATFLITYKMCNSLLTIPLFTLQKRLCKCNYYGHKIQLPFLHRSVKTN
ncbi:hypothetical protein T02_12021 [Trichinella nativa]|uniref:Uncharacterized protein n=1 Tax=Trichinella nativa TaxID=6335 RepID=A0A0V1LS00_9BILA|nr:hypothetical protein T02_12021 [Trichinella nativa]